MTVCPNKDSLQVLVVMNVSGVQFNLQHLLRGTPLLEAEGGKRCPYTVSAWCPTSRSAHRGGSATQLMDVTNTDSYSCRVLGAGGREGAVRLLFACWCLVWFRFWMFNFKIAHAYIPFLHRPHLSPPPPPPLPSCSCGSRGSAPVCV